MVATLYVVIAGAVAVRLLSSPYLPELSNDRRSLIVGLVSFLPLLLLTIVDHLAARTAWWSGDDGAPSTTDQRRLFAASMQAAAYLWGLHLLRALLQQRGPTRGALPVANLIHSGHPCSAVCRRAPTSSSKVRPPSTTPVMLITPWIMPS